MSLKPHLPSLRVRLTRKNVEIAGGTFQQSRVSIGRGSNCDIKLKNFKYLSRYHLTIFLHNNFVKVVDGNSTLGTSYLGEKISSVEIASHGVFKIHDISLEVTFLPARISSKTNFIINNKELTQTASLLMQSDSDITLPKMEKTFISGDRNGEVSEKPPAVLGYPENSTFLRDQFFGGPRSSGRYSQRLSLRASLVWIGQVLDSYIFNSHEHIFIVGDDEHRDGLFVPGVNFSKKTVGYVIGHGAHICVANGAKMYISKAYSEPEFTHFKPQNQSAPSGMLDLDASDRCLVLINDKLGISYEFVDTSEQLTSSILRKEDYNFFVTVRNVLVLTLIVAGTLVMIGDSKIKSKNVVLKKERIVQVVIPEEKKEEPKPEPKPEPRPEPEPKPKPPPQPKPEPKPQPKPQPKPRPQPKFRPQPRPRSVVKPRPSVRLNKKTRPSSSPPRSSSPKVQKPTNNVLAAFASFNKLNTFKPGKVSSQFKIDPKASKRRGESRGKNLITSLNKADQAISGLNSGKSALKNVSTGFSSKNLGKETGKRGVKGAPVGKPKLLNSPGKSQGLSSRQVMTVVKKHLSEVQRCYERALFNQPNLAGRIEYEWKISAKGKVKSVGVRRSEATGDKSLNDCVKKIFRKMKFPAATNGQSTVTSIGFPFGRL